MGRTVLPTKIKRVLQFVHHHSYMFCFNSWIYLPTHLSSDFQKFKLCPIRDYMYFRLASKQGLIHLKYNESYAMLTLQGKKALEKV
jgi:hypothetical protein